MAPYNVPVAELARAVEGLLGFKPRAGTVDKFQGQEGAVVIHSMATSSAEDAPRHLDFLYSRNRLNVAVSRARCFASITSEGASPRISEIFRIRYSSWATNSGR